MILHIRCSYFYCFLLPIYLGILYGLYVQAFSVSQYNDLRDIAWLLADITMG